MDHIVKANTRCVAIACERLGVPCELIDEFGNLISVNIGDKRHFFGNTRTPLNSESISTICWHKNYAYNLLHDELPMPLTKSYIDPKAQDEKKKYVTFETYDEIVKDIRQNFDLPVVVKMNAGAQGTNVFKCDSKRSIKSAVKCIFNQKKRHYDFGLLAQQYLEIEHEYRVILVQGRALLTYEKVAENKTINLSPLHNDNSFTKIIDDQALIDRIQAIVTASPTLSAMPWIGLDVAHTKDNELYVLELNAHPGFAMFVRDHGDEPLIKVYEEVVQLLQHES